MKISYSELEKGVKIILKNEPCQIIECSPMFKGRGSSVLRAKLKKLSTGEIFSHTFQSSDILEEAEIEREEIEFIYSHRDSFVFKNKERIVFSMDQIGDTATFLKPGTKVEAMDYKGKIINITLPIKMHFKVIEAPPNIKGNRSQPGTKTVTLETGAKINVPMFIEQGNIIEVNTETKEYVKRVE